MIKGFLYCKYASDNVRRNGTLRGEFLKLERKQWIRPPEKARATKLLELLIHSGTQST